MDPARRGTDVLSDIRREGDDIVAHLGLDLGDARHIEACALADLRDCLGGNRAALGLDFHAVVTQTRETRPQKQMRNSAQQVRNLWGAFEIEGPVPSGPVLLVDDLADSRWTLTVVAHLLTEAGVPAVVPLALAKATGG